MRYKQALLNAIDSDVVHYTPTSATDMKNEIEEVYAKAKAFNEILNIDLDQHEIIVHGTVEEIIERYLVKKAIREGR